MIYDIYYMIHHVLYITYMDILEDQEVEKRTGLEQGGGGGGKSGKREEM